MTRTWLEQVLRTNAFPAYRSFVYPYQAEGWIRYAKRVARKHSLPLRFRRTAPTVIAVLYAPACHDRQELPPDLAVMVEAVKGKQS